jgi:hypothetical protein
LISILFQRNIISNKFCANNIGVCNFCGEDGLKQPCHLSKALCDLIEFDSDSLGIKNAFLCKSCTLIAKKYDSCFSKENEKFHACKFPVHAIPGSGCCICGQLGANGNRKVSYALKYSQVKINDFILACDRFKGFVLEETIFEACIVSATFVITSFQHTQSFITSFFGQRIQFNPY